ncbi:MAG: Major cardiolipin synthase ClsA [Gammaproteobacteria bacterium]|nr:Major cardiolipin synthase ClsA [Gammaproteobacteria bacterium]
MASSGLTTAHWLTLHGMVTVAAVLFYVITSHVKQQRRNPAAAIAWMLFILLLPYLALPAYWIFGSRKLPRPPSRATPATPRVHDVEDWAVQTALALGQPAPAAYRDLGIHGNGQEARHALLDMIDSAQQSIDLCTFILRDDSLGCVVVDRLCHRARSGVRVRLLLDGLGSLMAGRPDLKQLTDAGGTWTLFVPPLHSRLKGRTNLRDHRKLLVTDADHDSGRMWCGGRNLAAEYFDGEPNARPWRDLSFDLRGPVVRQAQALFDRDWNFAMRQETHAETPAPIEAQIPPDGAQLVASGPDQADDTVHALLVTAAYRARQRIALVTPYFVPDTALLMALCLAVRRGVSVDLVIPARSNHRLSDLARSRALRSLVQTGGRVWLAPGMLHAKLVVVDDALALVGSANLDTRSLFLNYELMVAFHKAADVRRFAAWFADEQAASQPCVPTQPGIVRDVVEGLLIWLAFQL